MRILCVENNEGIEGFVDHNWKQWKNKETRGD